MTGNQKKQMRKLFCAHLYPVKLMLFGLGAFADDVVLKLGQRGKLAPHLSQLRHVAG